MSVTGGNADPSVDGRLSHRVPPELLVVAAVAVLVGGVLRFVAPSPLWLDEALSVHIASLPVGELLDALRSDGHPPLYYLLLHGWIGLFGESDVAVRALSGVFSVLMLPLAWLAGRRLGGPVLGAVALAVVAMSPYVLRYSSESRMYALVLLLVLVGWLLVRSLLDGADPRRRAPLLAAVSGALLLTHYWSFYLVAVTVVVLAVAWRRAPAPRRGRLAMAGAAVAGGGVFFLPWLPSFLDQLGATGTPWAPPVRPGAALGVTLVDLGGGSPNEALVGVAVLGVCLVLGLMGRATSDQRRIELDLRTVPGVRAEAAVVLGTLLLGTTVGWLTDSTFVPRYAATVVPLVLLVVAAGIVCVQHRVARMVLLGAVLLAGVVGTGRALTTERTQAGAIADAILAEARPGDVVVSCPDQLGPSSTRALSKRASADHGLEEVVYPSFAGPERVDWVDYAERVDAADPASFAAELEARTPPEAAVFLIWSPTYRTHEGDCEAVQAELAALRGGVVDLEVADADRFTEHATLSWYPAG